MYICGTPSASIIGVTDSITFAAERDSDSDFMNMRATLIAVTLLPLG